jgi:hypothetical protein
VRRAVSAAKRVKGGGEGYSSCARWEGSLVGVKSAGPATGTRRHCACKPRLSEPLHVKYRPTNATRPTYTYTD